MSQVKHGSARWVLAVAGLFWMAGVAISQEATKSEKAKPAEKTSKVAEAKAKVEVAKPKGEVKPAEPAPKPAEPKAPSAKPEPASRSEHIIYVPYSKLSDVFGKEEQKILLPLAEYQKLWDTVRKLGLNLSKPPAPAVITAIEYSGVVNGDVADLKAKLLLDVLTEDWVRLPTTFAGVAIAKADGATLSATGAGQYELVLQGKGKRTVTLELTAPVTRSPLGRNLTIKGPVSGSATLDLLLPEKEIAIEVTPKLATSQIQDEKNQTRLRSTLGATDQLSVAWRAKTQTVVAEALVVANNLTTISVADGVVHTHAKIDYQLLRGETAELAFSMPAGERLLDVQADGLRDWRIGEKAGAQVVTLRFHAPVKSKVTANIDTERPIPAGVFPVGLLRAVGVQRETGLLAVGAGEDLSLTVVDRQGLTRMAQDNIPKETVRAGASYYKYYAPDFKLTIEVAPVAPRIAVVHKIIHRLEEGRVRGESNLEYEVQRAGIFSTKLRLPVGYELDELTATHLERYETQTTPNGLVINIQFGQKLVGAIKIRLVYSQPRPNANAGLKLPIPEPLDAKTERGYLALLAHESFETTGVPNQTTGVRPATPAELAAQGLTPPSDPRMSLAAAFQYLARPVDVGFTVKRRNTRVVAQTFTTWTIQENSARCRTAITYDVQYAGTDTFTFEIPQSVADKVEIVGDNIKEKRRGEPANGMVPWTIVLHTSSLGKRTLIVTFQEPIELDALKSSTVKIDLKLAQPTGVEREDGKLVVFKDRALALEDTSENIEPVDPREFESLSESKSSEKAEAQLAYRYYRHPVKVSLKVTKHQIQPVVETILTRALIEAVAPEDRGSADAGAGLPITYRARYSVKSSQRQRLKIALPKGAKFLGVSVAGRNVLPEKAEPTEQNVADVYLINVSRTTSADVAFPMTIVFEHVAAPGLQQWTLNPASPPKISLVMPFFFGDVTFQRVFWKVWLPKRYTAVGKPSGFLDENEPAFALFAGVGYSPGANPTVDTWTNEWNQSAGQALFEFPTVGRPFLYSDQVGRPVLPMGYGYVPVMIALGSTVALLLMLAFQRCSLAFKVSVVLLFSLAALIGGLFDPGLVYRWLSASTLGIAVGAIFWGWQTLAQFARNLGAVWSDMKAMRRAKLMAIIAASQTAAVPTPDAPADKPVAKATAEAPASAGEKPEAEKPPAANND